MKFAEFLKESFKPDVTYPISMLEIDDKIIFDIFTNEARDYRLVLNYLENRDGIATFECKIGYASDNKSTVIQVKTDFYNTDILINTIKNIFLSLHADMYTTPFKIIHKFQGSIDMAYKMMLVSLLKHELKDFYKYDDITNLSKDMIIYSYIPIPNN